LGKVLAVLSLTILHGPNKGHTFHLTGERATIVGRQSDDLRLLDRNISRQHAQINLENGTWVLRDLGSSNGTLVNGQRVTMLTELEEGDHLRFGRCVLVVEQLTAEPPALDDTRVVDVESMDHVLLSPEMPHAVLPSHQEEEEKKEQDDVLRVEAMGNLPRADEPEVVETAHDSHESHESIFDFDAPEQNSAPLENIEPAQLPVDEQPLPIEQLDADLQENLDGPEDSAAPELGTCDEQTSDEEPADILTALDDEAEQAPDDEPVAENEDVEVAPETPANLIEAIANPFEVFDQVTDPPVEAEVASDQLFADTMETASVEPIVEEPATQIDGATTDAVEPEHLETDADSPLATETVVDGDDVVTDAQEDVVTNDVEAAVNDDDTPRPLELDKDDPLQPPRPLGDPAKSRLIWPIAVAVLLLLGSGTGIFFTTMGDGSGGGSGGGPDSPNISPATLLEPSPKADGSRQSVPDTLPSDTPSASIDMSLTTSPLEDGPRLLGERVLAERVAHQPPPPEVFASSLKPHPRKQSPRKKPLRSRQSPLNHRMLTHRLWPLLNQSHCCPTHMNRLR